MEMGSVESRVLLPLILMLTLTLVTGGRQGSERAGCERVDVRHVREQRRVGGSEAPCGRKMGHRASIQERVGTRS